MLPANEAYRDKVRQELDRRILTEVLDLEDTILEQLDTLRFQWCEEPTVVGGKTQVLSIDDQPLVGQTTASPLYGNDNMPYLVNPHDHRLSLIARYQPQPLCHQMTHQQGGRI